MLINKRRFSVKYISQQVLLIIVTFKHINVRFVFNLLRKILLILKGIYGLTAKCSLCHSFNSSSSSLAAEDAFQLSGSALQWRRLLCTPSLL